MRTIKLSRASKGRSDTVISTNPFTGGYERLIPVVSVWGIKRVSKCSPEVIYYILMLSVCQAFFPRRFFNFLAFDFESVAFFILASISGFPVSGIASAL